MYKNATENRVARPQCLLWYFPFHSVLLPTFKLLNGALALKAALQKASLSLKQRWLGGGTESSNIKAAWPMRHGHAIVSEAQIFHMGALRPVGSNADTSSSHAPLDFH